MMKYLFNLLSILFIVFWSCQKEDKRTNDQVTQDSIITIKKRDFDISSEYYDLNVYKQDYSIIRRLQEIGLQAFSVKFRMSYTNKFHIGQLTIQELKDTALGEKLVKHRMGILNGYFFKKKVAFSLPYLEQLSIDGEAFKGNIHVPTGFKNLKLLGIGNNPELEAIYFKEPMNLTILRIPENNIKSINFSFRKLVKLKRLYLSENQLKDLDLSYIPWVNRVDISDNPISFDKIDSLRLKYPKINIVSYSYKKKRPGNYIDRSLETPVYE